LKVFVFLLIIASVLATPLDDFDVFCRTFNKSYSTAEEHYHRRQIFAANLRYINDFNAKSKDVQLGMNNFGDLSYAEWSSTYIAGGCYRSQNTQGGEPLNVDVPVSIDWRTKGAVTPVKNQGQCGSCWAFSTTGALEGIEFISSGQLVSLSEQELVDCSKNGNYGCSGGFMETAFRWIIQNGGLCKGADYPYTAHDGTCKNATCTSVPQSKIVGYKEVPRNNEVQLQAAVAQQPVSVAIEADQPAFQFYKSGIFSQPCGVNLNHGVLAVGYGVQGTTPFWIVKNSWGAYWGDKGYIYLIRGTSTTSPGQCGIAIEPSYPTQ
jgi:C1A family cysteine protease